MLKRFPAWLDSVLSLASTTRRAIRPAAFSNCGAMDRQGPHQGAQKSTTTGKLDREMNFSNVWSVSSIG